MGFLTLCVAPEVPLTPVGFRFVGGLGHLVENGPPSGMLEKWRIGRFSENLSFAVATVGCYLA